MALPHRSAGSRAVLERRLRLVELPTPVARLDRLAAHLGKAPGTIWIKRDDVTSLAGGGNKARKLEYALVEALDLGADQLVTTGGQQSNAARATAAAARMLGLGCTILMHGSAPGRPSGNLLLDELLGAELVWADPADPRSEERLLDELADALRAAGRSPVVVPIGVSTPVGALGYVRAADEIAVQVPDGDVVITATGSAGTHAGLAAGFGDHRRVLGVRVGTRKALRARVEHLAGATSAMLGGPPPVGGVRLDERHLGAGYAAHTDSAAAAMILLARLEGVILDPVYTGKAMAGLITCCREGSIGADEVVVFLHTGGLPGLFADDHADWLAGVLSPDATSAEA